MLRKFIEWFYSWQPTSGWVIAGWLPINLPIWFVHSDVAWCITLCWAVVSATIAFVAVPFESARRANLRRAQSARGIRYRRAHLHVEPDGDRVVIEYKERPEGVGPQLLYPFYLNPEIVRGSAAARYVFHATDEADEAHRVASELRARAEMKPIDKHSQEARLLAKVLSK